MMRRLSGKQWAILAVLALALVWWFGHGKKDAGKGAAAVNVTAVQAARRDVPQAVALVGSVIPYETVTIKSRLDSQIVKVAFKDGDTVQEGQTLFVLDDRALRAQIGQLKAAVDKEKATLVNAKLQYERMEKLVKTSAVSQAAADQAKAEYNAQAAQASAAQATLDNARVQLSYTVITAPIGGRTGTINVTRGNNVRPGDAQPLVTINQVVPIRVQFALAQRYYAPLKAAMAEGDVQVSAQHQESSEAAVGKLEYVDNAIDTASGTFTARAVFNNEDEKLWPGMFVNVSLDLGALKNVLTIPAVAVQGDEDARFVFALDADGKKAVKKPVAIGQNDGDVAVVTQGLEDTDRVITDGLLRLTDGAAVEVATPAAAESVKP